MIESNISVKLEKFDGPLALLLHLVQKEEMDIQELDINKITWSYLDYLQKMQDLNFDVAGDYLYMAASLLHIKSKSLSQTEQKVSEQDEDDSIIQTKTQLIEKLEELQKYQLLGEKLYELDMRGREVFTRPKVNRKSIQNSILTPMDLESLTDSMIDFLRREKRKYTVIKRDRLSIKEKLKQLKLSLQVGTQTTLNNLINDRESIEETVITFISLLELARLKKLDIFQNDLMGEIYVDVKEALESFDVDTATGFEPETTKAEQAPTI